MQFAGKTVLKSDMLRGAKAIVYLEDRYYASPAIHSLLKSEKGPKLKHLILHLRVVDVNSMDDIPDDVFEARPVGS